MQPAFISPRTRRLVLATAFGAAGCWAAVIAMQVAGYVWLHGAFPELVACALLLAGIALVVAWLRIQRRLSSVQDRESPLRRMSKSKQRAIEPQARHLLRRRAAAVRGMLMLGACAVFALVSGTLGDDPAWRDFIATDPEIQAVHIASVDEIEEVDGRHGRRFNFEFSGSIPTSTSIRIVGDHISIDVDPREVDDWTGLVWAVYDPDDPHGSVVFTDSHREAEEVLRFPLTPVFGFGGYALVLFSALACSTSPTKRAAKMSKSGVLPYYRGQVTYRLSWSNIMFFVILGLIAGTVYLGCYLRLIPTSVYTDALFQTSSLGVFIYGVPMHVFALIIGVLLTHTAIGNSRIPFR